MNKTQALPSAIHPSLNRAPTQSDAMTNPKPKRIQPLFPICGVLVSVLIGVIINAISASAYAQQDSKAGKGKAALTVQVVQHINGLMEYIMRVAAVQVPVIKEQVV